VARALLRAGGISALQTASIEAALPFLLVMLIMTLALIRSRTDDPPGEIR
jgi:choline/glycine/proline betaine transport protein